MSAFSWQTWVITLPETGCMVRWPTQALCWLEWGTFLANSVGTMPRGLKRKLRCTAKTSHMGGSSFITLAKAARVRVKASQVKAAQVKNAQTKKRANKSRPRLAEAAVSQEN